MPRELMFEVITADQASEKILSHWQLPARLERVGLRDTWNRILSEDVVAPEDVPGFSRSTMDGYAVNAEDTFGASESLPAYLTLRGEVPMGVKPEQVIDMDETMAVATGSMLPQGANAVVMIERTAKIDDRTIAVFRPVAPGENILEKGEDVGANQVVLRRGTLVRGQEMGVLASLGITEVEVFCLPNVGIISTGNELVEPEKTPSPGQIRDSNSYTLYGAVKDAGGQPHLYRLVPDQEEEFRATILKAVEENQVVLVSGGSSVGTRDLTLKILNQLGELLFHGIAVKPGKPTLATVVKDSSGTNTLVIGLPGHPVSAFITFRRLVEPLLKGHLRELLPPACVYGRLTKNIPSQAGREEHVRVRLISQGEQVLVEPVFGKSGMLTSLTAAHGVVTVSLEAQGLAAGSEVAVKLFKEL
ncbi:molybdopterin molybdotransferase MoeA [Metallumcola ferriviriculae]|uniref:Molybdopterin molybdenumtransferase n=1 Tax=Metallumcola ferriviriculae TaxID=3039180 RepID=A0AAU0URB6_9FIRM|nr:molybdopterin molybdotransferase MoeA [Desulfitibacteraceae bacterium MK1]